MNRKILLGIILALTSLALIPVLALRFTSKYDKLILSEDDWNSIITSRTLSTSINIESIKFNDYNLLIDNDDNIIYYSVVDSANKYNPRVKYTTSGLSSIAINSYITDESLEQTDDLKIMVYNDKYYKIYSLIATKYPILNVIKVNEETDKKKSDVELEVFDNHIDAPQRLLKLQGKFKTIEKDKIYTLSLIKESLGNNKRENHISIFGMEKRDEYVIKKIDGDSEKKCIRLFINNKYSGLYSLEFKERRIDNYERNRENNR